MTRCCFRVTIDVPRHSRAVAAESSVGGGSPTEVYAARFSRMQDEHGHCFIASAGLNRGRVFTYAPPGPGADAGTVGPPKLAGMVGGPIGSVFALDFSPTKPCVAMAGSEGVVRVFEIAHVLEDDGEESPRMSLFDPEPADA